MKRRRVHLLFSLSALSFGLLAAYQGWHLQHADHVNGAIANASVAGLDDTVPEARFARATALSKAGSFEDAARAYKGLIQVIAPT